MVTPENIFFVFVAYFLGGFVKGALGLGLPVIAVAVLALVMDVRSAVAIFLFPGVFSNIWQAFRGTWAREIVWRLRGFLVASVIGIVMGVSILSSVPSDEIVVVLGVILIVYSLYSVLAPRLPEPGRREVWMGPLSGWVGGLMFGTAGIFLVPGVLYVEALRMKRDMFVQALGIVFLTITGALAVSLTGFSLVTTELAILSLIALVPVALGIWMGQTVRRYIPETAFRKLLYAALTVSGLYMIASAAV